ncbi:MAG: hypothetical protein P4L79_06240 [Legionella sp.]|uniref:hypothetical protein n=1 Tax=Legionella sp. TaxID=459 RepID=UPI002840AFB0|nr:hypothetical protein [Legionella sp.]
MDTAKYLKFIDYISEKSDQVSCFRTGRFRRRPIKEILQKYAKSGDASEEEKKEIEELLKNL